MHGKDDYIGKPFPSRERLRFLAGVGRYVADLRFADLLHVGIVRSEHAHARIRSIDAGAARRLPGVLGIFTLDDIRPLCGSFPLLDVDLKDLQAPPCHLVSGWHVSDWPLADGEACHVGRAVAAVVAESRRCAVDAAGLVDVRYELLPAVVDLEKAALPDSPKARSTLEDNVAFRWDLKSGDPEDAFRKADRVARQRFVIPRTAPCALEPRGVVAWLRPVAEELTVWTSTEAPHLVRSQLSRVLGLSENKVRVVAPDVGGGFGSKASPFAEEALLGALSRLFPGRPLQWLESRGESLMAAAQAGGQVGDLSVAVRKDGRLLGLKYEGLADLGVHQQPCTPAAILTGRAITGAYDIPSVNIRVTGVFTNKAPTDTSRGSGRLEAAYMIERMLDILAGELELDPFEIRRINFPPPFPAVQPSFKTATGLRFDSGDYGKALDAVSSLSELPRLREELELRRRAGELVGLGLSAYVDAGAAVTPEAGGGESALVRVSPSGKVDVLAGASPDERCLEMTLAQIAADVLGTPPEAIRVRLGDTALSPALAGSARASCMSAVFEAARKVERRMRTVAASTLRVPEEYVEHAGGQFSAGDVSLSFERVALEAYYASLPPGISAGLEATCFFKPPGSPCPFGAHVCVASVDRETGDVRVERYFAVDDFGKVVHPQLVEGQVHGGVARGIVQALEEEVIYDADGQLLTGALMAGPALRARRLPWLQCARTETPTSASLLGAKDAGDAGAVASVPAVANAVMDALSGLGVKHVDIPLRPEKLWRILKGGSAS
jgi:carbon-monoxide dehydrogenase large subunit